MSNVIGNAPSRGGVGLRSSGVFECLANQPATGPQTIATSTEPSATAYMIGEGDALLPSP